MDLKGCCIVCHPEKDWAGVARMQCLQGQTPRKLELPACEFHDEPTKRERANEIMDHAGLRVPGGWMAPSFNSASEAMNVDQATLPGKEGRLALVDGGDGDGLQILALEKNAPRVPNFPPASLYSDQRRYLFTAYRHVSYAIEALEKAKTALATVDSGDLPTRTVDIFADVIDGWKRKIMDLMKTKKTAGRGISTETEHCVRSKEIAWRHDVPIMAQKLAPESLEDQVVEIEKLVNR